MDGTLTEYMGEARPDVLLEIVESYMQRCRLVGGVFTFLCHNTALQNPSFSDAYASILDKLAGHAKFDWRGALDEQWAADNWNVTTG
jgi:hypothetical protein